MKPISTLIAAAALIGLAGCASEPADNVQQRAENVSDRLETRAGELEAEAANVTGNAADTLENQQKALELEANEAVPANSVANQITNAQ